MLHQKEPAKHHRILPKTKRKTTPKLVQKRLRLLSMLHDKCVKLPAEEDVPSCVAVLRRNPNQCENATCGAVLGDETLCTSSLCVSLARRDLTGVTDPSICEALVEKEVRSIECSQAATSVKELEACAELTT